MKLVRMLPTLAAMTALALLGYAAVATIGQTEAQAPGKSQKVVPIAPMPDSERQRLYHPGAAWDGKGPSVTEAQASAFADYSLYWFGPSIRGYNLQAIKHVKYTAPAGAQPQSMDSFTFIYGRCTPDGEAERCAAPAYIHVQPICAVLPKNVLEGLGRPDPVRTLAGGAQLQRYSDGHVIIWTGDVVLDIGIVAYREVRDVDLAELRGLGRNGFQPGQPLAPPNFASC